MTAMAGPSLPAQDIERQAGSWKIPLWVARDECPPSPGCMIESKPRVPPAALGLPDAVVWQYALSPRRPEFTGGCPQELCGRWSLLCAWGLSRPIWICGSGYGVVGRSLKRPLDFFL